MISVIIPCFNSEEYIARAIESVLKQTYTNYEIILVNNNSSDNTLNILESYAKKDPAIFQVFNEYKTGAPAARNKGLSAAKGDWIQFLDADDELLPDKLKDQVAIIDSSAADVIVGNCYLYKNTKSKTSIKTRDIETDVWKGLLQSKLGITSANLWRKRALLAIDGWNETRSSSQEYDLLFRILKNNDNVEFSKHALTIVHVRTNSIHKSAKPERFIEILDNNVKLRLEIKEYLRSKRSLTKQLSYIADTYIYSYLVTTTGVSPLSRKKGIVSEYVKKTLRESNLNLPLSFIIAFHLNRLRGKILNRCKWYLRKKILQKKHE